MIDRIDARDQATLDFYEKEALASVISGKGAVSRWPDDFTRSLPAGARILELGCGGWDAEALLALGFEVDATDGSPAMAAKAQERLRRPVKVMHFDELSDIGVYNGVWANASLLHVPRTALAGVLALNLQALKPGGIFFANFKAGGVSGRDRLGRCYNYPDRTALTEIYAQSGRWDMLSGKEFVGGGYDGVSGPWIAVIAQKPQR